MKKENFIRDYYTYALEVEERYKLNPVVILSQAAIESGWATSLLCHQYNNFFGITGYGRPNAYWQGSIVRLSANSLPFRTYDTAKESFLDYGRLIRAVYPQAADVSYTPTKFAQAIAYSKYISEVNGDDRPGYCNLLVAVARLIEENISQIVK